MKKSTHWIRIYSGDHSSFMEYADRNHIKVTFLSADLHAEGGMMFSALLSPEEATSMKISCNLVGMLRLNKALDRQVQRNTAKMQTNTLENP